MVSHGKLNLQGLGQGQRESIRRWLNHENRAALVEVKVLCDKYSHCPYRMGTDLKLPCSDKLYVGCKFYDSLRRHHEQDKGMINEEILKQAREKGM